MKNSFENSFRLFSLLKAFVGLKGCTYTLYSRTMLNNRTIAMFIERNNHHVKTNKALSDLLDALLDNPDHNFSFARKN